MMLSFQLQQDQEQVGGHPRRHGGRSREGETSSRRAGQGQV